jgi:hypothetical protein
LHKLGSFSVQRKIGLALLCGGVLGVAGTLIVDPGAGATMGALTGAALGYAYAMLLEQT